MRIRSIKPEFWRSDDTDELDWHTRLVFIGLWSYVDDNGVGLYKLPSVVADLFANDFSRDPTETLRRVSTALDALEGRGMIARYSVDGKAFLYICNWAKHQRVSNPNKPRYPTPTSGNIEPIEDVRRSSVDPLESLGTGTGEQGNRGTGEQEPSTASLAGSRKKPSVPIPDDWVPNESHRARALGRGMDVDALADEMRNWALSKDDRKANWDAAFTNWINRADVKPSNAVRRVIAGGLWEGD